MQFDKVIKRDGTEFPFNIQKIEEAIEKAFIADGNDLEHNSAELAEAVLLFLTKKIKTTPSIEDIQDMVELVLSNTGYANVAKKYILYRETRRLRRGFLEVEDDQHQDYDETDVSLIVENIKKHSSSPWDANIIVKRLSKVDGLSSETAKEIASRAERKILALNFVKISTRFINEITSNLLFELGYKWVDFNSDSTGLPLSDIDRLFFHRYSHSSNNPDKIRTSISNHVLKEYSLSSVFSPEVAEAHRVGQIDISGIGHPGLFSSGVFSVERIKRNGLDLEVLPSYSKPAQHMGVLSSHINTFLSCMRSYFYGPVALSYLNIYLAPFIEGLSDREIIQEAQNLIYITSQNAFSQGGMSLPIDFNLYSYVPSFLKNKKAIGHGGVELQKTYQDFEALSLKLMGALLECLDKGDGVGNEFVYPIVNVHLVDQSFGGGDRQHIMAAAIRVASKRKRIRFIKDSAECSQHSSQIQLMQKHFSSSDAGAKLDAGAFVMQTVSVNLPQILLKRNQFDVASVREFLPSELSHLFGLAYQAHQEKLRFMKRLAVSENSILKDVLCLQADGQPIVGLENVKTLVSIAGLNEFVYLLTQEYFDASANSFVLGQEILQLINRSLLSAGFSEFEFDVNPDSSAAQRFARLDKNNYPGAEEVMTIDDDTGPSYTNSFFIRKGALLSLSGKFEKESLLGQFVSASSRALVLPDAPLSADEITQFIKTRL